jgi:hypothetical protein
MKKESANKSSNVLFSTRIGTLENKKMHTNGYIRIRSECTNAVYKKDSLPQELDSDSLVGNTSGL